MSGIITYKWMNRKLVEVNSQNKCHLKFKQLIVMAYNVTSIIILREKNKFIEVSKNWDANLKILSM